jgi:hypothetical protein
MSQQVQPGRTAGGTGVALGGAIAGVVFCDFIGVLLFAVPTIGWVLGLACMFAGSPVIASLALEGRPNRGRITAIIGVANALIVIVAAVALIALALQSFQWG